MTREKKMNFHSPISCFFPYFPLRKQHHAINQQLLPREKNRKIKQTNKWKRKRRRRGKRNIEKKSQSSCHQRIVFSSNELFRLTSITLLRLTSKIGFVVENKELPTRTLLLLVVESSPADG